MNNFREHRTRREGAENILKSATNPDERALAFMAMGQLDELKCNWQAAIAHYRSATLERPIDQEIRYFCNNNLGFSLIQTGKFAEAIMFCEKAIETNTDKYNAHKNLGLAYEGQRRFSQAARCYITATWRGPGDQRALNLLCQVLKNHPELVREHADLQVELDHLKDMFLTWQQIETLKN